MESNSINGDSLELEMQRLSKIVVDKGYEAAYCVHGLNESPSFLEMLRTHVNVTTHKDGSLPMFPVRLTGAVCGMFQTGAMFASFEISKHGRSLRINDIRLTLRDDDDHLTDCKLKLKSPNDLPDRKRAIEMLIAKQKWLKRQWNRKIKRQIKR